MAFIELLKDYKASALKERLDSVTKEELTRILRNDTLTPHQFLSLLSPAAAGMLEEMAQKARRLTLSNFGRTIQLYTPVYISNYCDSSCVYCGFSADIKRPRRKLTMDELDKEARYIADTGLRHILLLTGSSRSESPLSYIKESVRLLRKYFSSVSIEVYSLSEQEYKELIDEGVDGLTIYQETYNRIIYKKVHPRGPKSGYSFRLESAERALRKKMRVVNIGALLGLNDWREDGFYTGIHAKYLQERFPEAEISISVPRIKPQREGYVPAYKISDRNITQLITAFRLFLPRMGITLSTRESPALRDNLLPLGVTKMSADSTTVVGGHTADKVEQEDEQFHIYDNRSVSDIRRVLLAKGYQPVFKDWIGGDSPKGDTLEHGTDKNFAEKGVPVCLK